VLVGEREAQGPGWPVADVRALVGIGRMGAGRVGRCHQRRSRHPPRAPARRVVRGGDDGLKLYLKLYPKLYLLETPPVLLPQLPPFMQSRLFSHEKLHVYDKALSSVAHLAQFASLWDKRHAVVDQLLRASESVVLNLAEGARLWSRTQKTHLLEYAIGSALECAACLDIAMVKRFLAAELALQEKRGLCEIVKMLVGLRKSWAAQGLHEEPPAYGDKEEPLFPHERLDAYRLSLEFMQWLHAVPGGAVLTCRLYRQVDKSGTSVVLNLAESNGRYAAGDRRNLLDVAAASTVKAAAYLDLCERTEGMDSLQKAHGAELLRQISRTIGGLMESQRSEL
jgi:four helix bundle protein